MRASRLDRQRRPLGTSSRRLARCRRHFCNSRKGALGSSALSCAQRRRGLSFSAIHWMYCVSAWKIPMPASVERAPLLVAQSSTHQRGPSRCSFSSGAGAGRPGSGTLAPRPKWATAQGRLTPLLVVPRTRLAPDSACSTGDSGGGAPTARLHEEHPTHGTRERLTRRLPQRDARGRPSDLRPAPPNWGESREPVAQFVHGGAIRVRH